MISALFFVVFSGLIWSANGVVFSYIAIRKLNFITIMSVATVMSALIGWTIFSDHQMMLHSAIPRLGSLSVVIITSGVFATLGVIVMQKGMQQGHHGIVFTVAQSAMLVPFVYGTVVFKEPISFSNCLGIFCIVISFLALGKNGHSSGVHKVDTSTRYWFILALVSFLLFGIHQCLASTPSYWYNWKDIANLRPPLLLTGFAIGYLIPMLAVKKFPGKNEILIGVLDSGLIVTSQAFIFKGMDAMARVNMVSLVYPVAVGTSIVSFTMYSLFLIKERATISSVFGIIFGILGLSLISIK